MWYWIALIAGGLLEIGWAVCLKHSDGMVRPLPAVATVVLLVGSMALLAIAMQRLPLGTAYVVWTGIGAAGTAIYGMAVLGESREPLRLLFLLLIIGGIAGLHATAGGVGAGER